MRVPLAIAVIAMLLSIAVDVYIYFDIKSTTRRKLWWGLYACTSVVCWLFLLVMLCLPKRSEDSDILPIMWMLYSYLTIYASKVAYTAVSIAGRGIAFIFRKKDNRHIAQWLALGLAVWILAIMWYGVTNTRKSIVIEEVTFQSQKLPLAFENYRIVQISDLHTGTWGIDPTFLSELVDSINSLNPDVVFFTGDIVNRRTEELLPFVPVLSRIKAPDGVFSVLGNHDYGDYMDWSTTKERTYNNSRLLRVQESMGWKLLNNEFVSLFHGGDSIILTGVENWGDPPFHTYGDLDKALSPHVDSMPNQNDGNFKILLTHNPEHWNREVSHNTNVDLTLSGHTHAMQLMLSMWGKKWSPAVYRYPLWGGMYERENKNGELVSLYVNIGAGEVGMPSRLFDANPEITLITLKRP